MLKATGFVRKADNLGRFSLPTKLRKKLGLKYNDLLEIYIEGEKIILSKYYPQCMLCYNSNEVIEYKNKFICKECINTMLVN